MAKKKKQVNTKSGAKTTPESNRRISLETVGIFDDTQSTKGKLLNYLTTGIDVLNKFNPVNQFLYRDTFNTPIGRLMEDAPRSVINRGYRALTGSNGTLIPGRTVTSLPADQVGVLREQILSKPGGNSFTDKDWNDYRGVYRKDKVNYAGGNRGLLNRSVGAANQLEHTLGQYNWSTDAYGNIIVEDLYDYNVTQGRNQKGVYGKVRKLAGDAASKSNEPSKGKIKYKINLGNPKYNWKVMGKPFGGGVSRGGGASSSW